MPRARFISTTFLLLIADANNSDVGHAVLRDVSDTDLNSSDQERSESYLSSDDSSDFSSNDLTSDSSSNDSTSSSSDLSSNDFTPNSSSNDSTSNTSDLTDDYPSDSLSSSASSTSKSSDLRGTSHAVPCHVSPVLVEQRGQKRRSSEDLRSMTEVKRKSPHCSSVSALIEGTGSSQESKYPITKPVFSFLLICTVKHKITHYSHHRRCFWRKRRRCAKEKGRHQRGPSWSNSACFELASKND